MYTHTHTHTHTHMKSLNRLNNIYIYIILKKFFMLLYIFPNNSHDSVTNCFEFKCSFESIADSLFLSLSPDMFMLCVKTEKPHTQERSRMR